MRTNAMVYNTRVTHEGAAAHAINPEQALRRSVLSGLLWEDTYYESGVEIAERIASLVPQVDRETVQALAVEARTAMKLRHMPLYLCVCMAKHKTHAQGLAETIEKVIQRPDELSEILALYAKVNGRTGAKKLGKVSRRVLRGVALAFPKFSEYALAKYDQPREVKLRDALFLSHAKPKDAEQAEVWKRLASGTLATPDTWEVALSATKGEAKREAWERLLADNKLGALALLRNLRNMTEAGVDRSRIVEALAGLDTARVLPFRFLAAARAVPSLEAEIEPQMLKAVAELPKLSGRTVLIVDNSGSMYGAKVSAKSDLDRSDAACALAILLREVCEDVRVIAFSQRPAEVPARRGFALRDAIRAATEHGSTNTQDALILAETFGYDRIIVVTDEQSHQRVTGPRPGSHGYFVNVSLNRHGIGYGEWTHIDGWSEAIVSYMAASEA